MTVRLLVLRLRQELLEWSGTWWFLLTLVVQAVLTPLVGLFVWSTVFPHDSYVTRYYVALILVTLMTESFEQYTFSGRIYDGTIGHELLRPQPVVLATIGTNIAIRIWLTTMGLPAVVLVAVALHTSFGWRDVLAMLPALLLAAALRFLWTYTLALLAFWTQRVHAIVGFGSYVSDLLGGTIAPILFLPASFGAVARVLPFYGMCGLPADIAIGRVSGLRILVYGGFEIGWLALFVGVAIVLWRAGLRSYTAVGA